MITVLRDGGRIEIQTQGYGHGAGLCQHGAGDMGQAGAGYREILSHYYPGTELAVINW
ncbi:MAG: hypothetical protein Q4B48_00425 [Syntrophomonadaceae bacterium]|nr:hypothetical protein [Syntrophomonadaceae bacterium]